jgi:hypothetical protein
MNLIIVPPATPVEPFLYRKFCLELKTRWPLSEPQKRLQFGIGAEISLKTSLANEVGAPETLMIVASAVPMKTNENSALPLASGIPNPSAWNTANGDSRQNQGCICSTRCPERLRDIIVPYRVNPNNKLNPVLANSLGHVTQPQFPYSLTIGIRGLCIFVYLALDHNCSPCCSASSISRSSLLSIIAMHCRVY